ncbi:PEP-CTERM sorting domain-containing protein [Stieleria neptunia]|uniref:PEP-CTERM sorting domain-containing protein n=1 Tax=Stieleria neptunia TaxID=2527979 RepID=UPI00119CC95B
MRKQSLDPIFPNIGFRVASRGSAAVVPEPSSFAIFGAFGLMAMGYRRTRQSRRSPKMRRMVQPKRRKVSLSIGPIGQMRPTSPICRIGPIARLFPHPRSNGKTMGAKQF